MSAKSTFIRVLLTTLRVFAVFVGYALIAAATESLVGPESKQAPLLETVVSVSLVTLASACVLSFIILRSSWSGSRLAWMMGLVCFGVHTLSPVLEALAWAGKPSRALAVSLFSGAVFASIWAPAAVTLLGRSQRSPEAPVADPSPERWASVLGVGVLWYLAVYLVLGCAVASSTAADGGTSWGPFCVGQGLEAIAASPWRLCVRVLQGVLWTLIAITIARTQRGSGLEAGLVLGALFGVAVAVHLPNAALPREAMSAHGIELAAANFVFGLLLGAWLRRRGRSTMTPLSGGTGSTRPTPHDSGGLVASLEGATRSGSLKGGKDGHRPPTP
jgi:hypothetical protein